MSDKLKGAVAAIAALEGCAPKAKIERICFDEIDLLPTQPIFMEAGKEGDGFETLHIYWGGYDYSIDLDRISRPLHLIQWVMHLIEKDWPLTTPHRLQVFIQFVALAKGWDIHAASELAARTTTNVEERAKLNPKLRFSILKRDNFACRACGNTAASGSMLHIDHIEPIARGGRTVADNLQTLCSTCNAGKGASQ